MDDDYRSRHEEFTRLKGSPSVLEILSIIFSYFLFIIIHTNTCIVLKVKSWSFKMLLAFDLLLFVLPQVLLLSVLSHYIVPFVAVLFTITFLWSLYLFIYGNGKIDVGGIFRSFDLCLPVIRMIIMILVCIMIFNIDLPICPRRFAKTEDFGLSLMDVGTGVFIATNAVRGSQVMYGLSENVDVMRQLTKAILPSFLIGALRCILVGLLGYQNNVKEYGLHWNFFLTIASVRLISTVAFSLIKWQNIVRPITFWMKLSYIIFCSCIFLVASHGLTDTFVGRLHQSWPNLEERQQSILIANIEGLMSLAGYLSLYFITVAYMMVFRHLTYQFMFQQSMNRKNYIISTLLLMTVSMATSWYFGLVSGPGRISRRFANPPYVSSMTFLFCFATFLEWIIHFVVECVRQASTYGDIQRPQLPASVYRHSMVYFLLSNLFTGCVNLSIDTTSFLPQKFTPDPVTGAFHSMSALSVCAQLILLSGYSLLSLVCINIKQLKNDVSTPKHLSSS